jgi:hypothetical protein
MKRYAWLVVAGLLASVGGLALVRVGRGPAPASEAAPRVETTALTLVLGESGLEPRFATVPKDHRVALEVRNDRVVAVTLALQGYEDRFLAGPIAPGQAWRGEFVADRPGEAFAWLADGEAVGRLLVTGSHLVEGHR